MAHDSGFIAIPAQYTPEQLPAKSARMVPFHAQLAPIPNSRHPVGDAA
jgi:hypothetical protein